ncbi:hypothetical protein OHA72_05810 [Dactylosporangium sp. NBC_01737]|uniref:hypothetical protein n=1 Tax=Dactylosporangium sp. NBC_01737 TaxID=2975959 RepID=UPI002E11035C|nr:hypothetical protein OHA72_05810 [Dactylosporangium sp. NBC_01737]
MSVSLILVPLAVAAVSAAHGLRSGRDNQQQVVCQVQTRMRDAALLAAALRGTDAEVTEGNGEIVAGWQGVRARFTRNQDEIWEAHFTGTVDEERAVDIVRAIDAGYGLQVQRAVLERLRERAPAAGLRLESESAAADKSVRLVFAVEGGSS